MLPIPNVGVESNSLLSTSWRPPGYFLLLSIIFWFTTCKRLILVISFIPSSNLASSVPAPDAAFTILVAIASAFVSIAITLL
jgi:hypothetical protein